MNWILIIKLIVFLYYGVTLLDGVKFRCDYFYHNIGWFRYHEIPMTWPDARLLCHLQGAEIASPISETRRTVMSEILEDSDSIFTGFHSTFSKGQFYTIEGIPLSEVTHFWADSEPDNKLDEENCLAINSVGKLSDVNCNEPKPFICYRKYSEKEVNICGTIDPEYHFDSRTNKCYKFHTNPRQFLRAQFTCSAEGGHLAIINSEEESEVIKDLFAKYPSSKMVGNFWKDVAFIGFHNWDESMDWTTIHGQSLQDAGFTKFSAGEPNNFTEGEYCGSVYRNGLMNDLWCEKHFAFICEKKPDFPHVCDISDKSIEPGSKISQLKNSKN